MKTVADPDLKLRGGGGGQGTVSNFFHLPFWSFILQSFVLFVPKMGEGAGRAPRAPPLEPPLENI